MILQRCLYASRHKSNAFTINILSYAGLAEMDSGKRERLKNLHICMQN